MQRNTWTALFSSVAVAALLGSACAPSSDVPESEGTDEQTPGISVLQAASAACDTSIVEGLSMQIIAEGACIEPSAFAEVPARANLKPGPNAYMFLEAPARDALVAALDAKPSSTMSVNSALRTPAQQYVLYRWYQTGRCGIKLAAKPGKSNHESGLALDVQQYGTWKSALVNRGFSWLGSKDPVHYDYAGAGATSYKYLGVLAFQRLWNRNHPDDKITEDGAWGPQTEGRMKKAPADGFPIGSACDSGCDAMFVDICDSPFQEDIEWLAQQGVTGGCDAAGPKYCPLDVVTRGQLATFLTVGFGLPSGPDTFGDDSGSPYEAGINAAAAAGWMGACTPDGASFCPDREVTRAELASVLAAALALPIGTAPDAFVDDDGIAEESAINAAFQAGLTAGCGGENFCPDGLVTREQLAGWLRAALEL